MTNLEFYKDKILENINNSYSLGCAVCSVMNDFDMKDGCANIKCDRRKSINWMLEEYKEPIKLKEWEKDLLKSFGGSDSTYEFEYFLPLMEMKKMGYFYGIKDTSYELGYILNNCEVVK